MGTLTDPSDEALRPQHGGPHDYSTPRVKGPKANDAGNWRALLPGSGSKIANEWCEPCRCQAQAGRGRNCRRREPLPGPQLAGGDHGLPAEPGGAGGSRLGEGGGGDWRKVSRPLVLASSCDEVSRCLHDLLLPCPRKQVVEARKL